jgi:hypothetical protein
MLTSVSTRKLVQSACGPYDDKEVEFTKPAIHPNSEKRALSARVQGNGWVARMQRRGNFEDRGPRRGTISTDARAERTPLFKNCLARLDPGGLQSRQARLNSPERITGIISERLLITSERWSWSCSTPATYLVEVQTAELQHP